MYNSYVAVMGCYAAKCPVCTILDLVELPSGLCNCHKGYCGMKRIYVAVTGCYAALWTRYATT